MTVTFSRRFMFLGKDDGDDKYFCNSEDFEWDCARLAVQLTKKQRLEECTQIRQPNYPDIMSFICTVPEKQPKDF